RNFEDLHRRSSVDVLAGLERLDQTIVLGEMSEDSKFDLGIVGAHDSMACLSDECFADLAPEFGTDGDVLKIRIRRREPAGRRDSLLPGPVNAPGFLTDQGGE